MKLTWLGHGSWRIEIEKAVILVDPALDANPSFPEDRRDEAVAGTTHILITHGHGDHTSGVPALAKRLGVPVVGICFGHQIIAQAMGGRVVKHPEGWRVGAHDYVIDGRPMVLNAWHQDQVVDLPPGAEIAGTNEFCQAAALVYDHRAFTVQPHPEFPDPFIAGLMEHRGGAVPPALLDEARTRRGQAKPAALANRIAALFKDPAAQRTAGAPADAAGSVAGAA